MCRAGLYTLCPNASGWIGINAKRSNGEFYNGGMEEYTAVPVYSCFKIPSSTTQKGAALIESMACAFRSIRHSGLTIEDNVVIFGACDYSNSTLLYAKLAGAGQVVVVDPSKKRLDVAKQLGADEVIDPTKQDVVKSIQKLMPFGADVVFISWNPYIEVSLTYNALASSVARIQGTLMWLKGQGDDGCEGVTFNGTAIKELTIKTTASFFSEEPWRGGRARGDYQGVLDSLAKNRVNPDPIVTKIIPFEKVNTKEDLDAIFKNYLNDLKIQFKIWGK
jgi:threonine dehydrogenase-like Zn-dependent dehydrogenase